jgi:RND family efflux transporter MFP subunit
VNTDPKLPHQSHRHQSQREQGVRHVSGRTLALVGLAVIVLFAVIFVIGFWSRHERLAKRERMAEELRDRPPVVLVERPKSTQRDIELSLPADIHAWSSTALYARTNGYLAKWNFDISDRVKKGEVLAVISAPDTDAELQQAKAELNQQETNRKLAQTTDDRFRGLIAIQGVTQEQLDQNRSALLQAQAGVKSAQASLERLNALVGFERIVAPYDGVVTGRTYDVGALISASSAGAGQELYDVAEDDRLRVFVNVPQAYVGLIHFGSSVDLTLERNYPGHHFTGVVARSTGTLDLGTRTLRTELDFSNTEAEFKVYPGMYGQAIFHVRREHPVLTISTSALLFETEGKDVAVVGEGNRVHLKPVTLGSDFGTAIEVLSGLTGEENIVVNPGEQMAEGLVVEPAHSQAPAANKGGA